MGAAHHGRGVIGQMLVIGQTTINAPQYQNKGEKPYRPERYQNASHIAQKLHQRTLSAR
jgi:hypothetical protein